MSDLVYNTDIIGTMLDCVKRYTPLKITNISLAGIPYMQTPGVATDRRTIHVLCPTLEKKDKLDVASNNGGLLLAHWGGKIIKGYIEKDVTWRLWRDGHGVGRFTLLVKEVVDE